MTSIAPTRPQPGTDSEWRINDLLATSEREPDVPEPETSEDLDVEGPNESAPGHNPEQDEEDR